MHNFVLRGKPLLFAALYLCCLPGNLCAQPADPPVPGGSASERPQYTAEQVRKEQKKVLEKYRLDSPPDLTQFGLEYAGGIYKWISSFAAKRDGNFADMPATPSQLGAAVEKMLNESYHRGFREERLTTLKKLFSDPNSQNAKELEEFSDPALGALSQYLFDYPESAQKLENNAQMRDLMGQLNSLANSTREKREGYFETEDGAAAFQILSRHFDGDAVLSNKSYENKSEYEFLIKHRYQRVLSNPAIINFDKRFNERGITFVEPPEPGVNSLLYGMRKVEPYALANQMELLQKKDASEIVKLKQELLRLSNFDNNIIRANAIHLLGRLHDENMATFFVDKLKDRDSDVRAEVASALGSILGTFKANTEGADWEEYLAKAPPILGWIATAPDPIDSYEPRRVIVDNLSNLNLMDEKLRKQFLRAFNDPRVLLVFIAASDREIDVRRGLHTDSAQLLWKRLKELQGKNLISELFSDPKLDAETKARAIARLNRYNLLEGELGADPKLVQMLPGLIFSQKWFDEFSLSPDEMLSAGRLALQTHGAEFAQSILKNSPQQGERGRRAALLSLLYNKEKLPVQQRDAVVKLAEKELPPEMFPKNRQTSDAFYSHWPQNKLHVALVMTQADAAFDFLRKMEQEGYARTGEKSVALAFTPGILVERSAKAAPPKKLQEKQVELIRNEGGKEIRIHVEIYPSDSGGWTLSKDAVTESLRAHMKDPDYQVVIYRGHIDDYGREEVRNTESRYKVYIDLGCDSVFSAERMIENCQNCAYFGTTTTAVGPVNGAFTREIIEALVRRESPREIDGRLEKTMPATARRFDGNLMARHDFEDSLRTFAEMRVRLERARGR